MSQSHEKPRIIVSTDIGGDDPDDFQSMVHYLVYSDLFDTEGLISSAPKAGRKEHILEVLEAYKQDYPMLCEQGDYPTPESLIAVAKQGIIETGGPAVGRACEGSDWIIERALADDPRPLWILAWGSLTDVAQAVHDHPEIKKTIRVYSLGSWNTWQDPESRDYLYNNHTDLWWIENNTTCRGLYMGGDQSDDLSNVSFVAKHIKGHGSLGDFYDAKKSHMKMTDTCSVLYLLSPMRGGPGNWDDPTMRNWGGSFVRTAHGPSYWTDDQDPELVVDGGWLGEVQGTPTISAWRVDWLRDMQTRMDRCVDELATAATG